MTTFARTDRSILGRWWWTVDRWALAAVGLLVAIGMMMSLAASPAVATRIELDTFTLVRHQLTLLPLAIAILVGASLLSPRWVRRLSTVGFLVFLVLTVLTLFVGQEIKGATRWLDLAGFSLQPSEFVKPFFAVVAAWMFSAQQGPERVPGNLVAILLYLVVAGVLMSQPDLGMTVVVSATWFAQFFLAGLPLMWVGILVLGGITAMVGAYFAFPHVTDRINSFLDPAAGDSYQVSRALDAFRNGGLFGQGPGEGTVKMTLPDAHADFVFAVIGEELGAIFGVFVVALFAFVMARGIARLLQERNLFVLLAAAGLLATFGLQAVINMASTLNLIPTKGMTLPFISYGGSSLLASALAVGMLLALTRRRVGLGEDS